MKIVILGVEHEIDEDVVADILMSSLDVLYDLNMNVRRSGPGPDIRRDNFIHALMRVLGRGPVLEACPTLHLVDRERNQLDMDHVRKVCAEHYAVDFESDVIADEEVRALQRKILRMTLDDFSEKLAEKLKLI